MSDEHWPGSKSGQDQRGVAVYMWELSNAGKNRKHLDSKKISNDQELIQSDPISCPQNQKGNN